MATRSNKIAPAPAAANAMSMQYSYANPVAIRVVQPSVPLQVIPSQQMPPQPQQMPPPPQQMTPQPQQQMPPQPQQMQADQRQTNLQNRNSRPNNVFNQTIFESMMELQTVNETTRALNSFHLKKDKFEFLRGLHSTIDRIQKDRRYGLEVWSMISFFINLGVCWLAFLQNYAALSSTNDLTSCVTHITLSIEVILSSFCLIRIIIAMLMYACSDDDDISSKRLNVNNFRESIVFAGTNGQRTDPLYVPPVQRKFLGILNMSDYEMKKLDIVDLCEEVQLIKLLLNRGQSLSLIAFLPELKVFLPDIYQVVISQVFIRMFTAVPHFITKDIPSAYNEMESCITFPFIIFWLFIKRIVKIFAFIFVFIFSLGLPIFCAASLYVKLLGLSFISTVRINQWNLTQISLFTGFLFQIINIIDIPDQKQSGFISTFFSGPDGVLERPERQNSARLQGYVGMLLMKKIGFVGGISAFCNMPASVWSRILFGIGTGYRKPNTQETALPGHCQICLAEITELDERKRAAGYVDDEDEDEDDEDDSDDEDEENGNKKRNKNKNKNKNKNDTKNSNNNNKNNNNNNNSNNNNNNNGTSSSSSSSSTANTTAMRSTDTVDDERSLCYVCSKQVRDTQICESKELVDCNVDGIVEYYILNRKMSLGVLAVCVIAVTCYFINRTFRILPFLLPF
jgi:hypothetical protein